ncbi:hypothetical protein H0E86_23695 [Streptomyces sp. SCSIO-PteL053]|nr:hypothetical protein H0E86_23695 [Streptomyces sp. SCSIO-PteL053]
MPPPLEYPYSGAAAPGAAGSEACCGPTPRNKPPKELRDAQAMMRRAGVLLALAMLLAMFVLGIR